MTGYAMVPDSEGPRREFRITVGLRAGYGPQGRIYDIEEAVRAAHRWMAERARQGGPFLSGMFTRGEIIYARTSSAGSAGMDREPVAIFSGEALHLAAQHLDDPAVEAMLNELAAAMGRVLEQEEVHVAYRDRVWTLTVLNP
ncbi:MAG: hypothetical protein JWL84_1064 [Rhodospirillales bacterium]|nr:hypothetical protein [Rhodospirillales bacterium]